VATPGDERSRHTARVLDRGALEKGLEIECDVCGFIAGVTTGEEAEAITRLHEEFVAVLIDRWRVPP